MSTTEHPTMSILIVDDESIVCESLAEWFRQDGYQVDVARNGKEALRLVAKNAYDIALVDIRMPGMDGLELQTHLTEAKPDLTIIIMTAYSSVESAVKALKAGAYDYITKPFDPDELSLSASSQRASLSSVREHPFERASRDHGSHPRDRRRLSRYETGPRSRRSGVQDRCNRPHQG